jgi:hypothetical protein
VGYWKHRKSTKCFYRCNTFIFFKTYK